MKCYMTGKPCDYYEANVDNNQMFIISPFGFPFDTLYSDRGEIQQVLKTKCHSRRSDETMRLGSIMCQGICKEIIESQYLFADLSLPNPNVYYELGLSFALKRRIIVAINTTLPNQYSKMFIESWGGNKEAFLSYTDLSSLKAKIEALDVSRAISRDQSDWPYEGLKIAILDNGDGGINGVYEAILNQLQHKFEFEEDLLKILTDSEKDSFRAAKWKDWKISTKRVENITKLDEIVNLISKSKICIVDTTAYRTESGPVTNPYMCFCLGLAHGFQKEVIPVTNTLHSSSAPFDVRGLWHIFFSKEEDLKSGLNKIIPRISVEFHKELSNAPYRMIWDGFLASKKTLSVIYCGRPAAKKGKTDSYYENRGPRTNIDSWDTKAVSEVSYYLAQKYPTSLIKPASPKTKSRWHIEPALETITAPEKIQDSTIEITEKTKEQLTKLYTNCIIVGSPDVNDYAEVILAKLYGETPFDPESKTVERAGFIFYKNNIKVPIRSTFYRPNTQNFVSTPKGQEYCDDETTFGVLTIAKNPFADQGRVIVLSGFTGLATCGLMELVIESEPDTDDPRDRSFKTELNEQLKKAIIPKFDSSLTRPFSALVRFEFDIKSHKIIPGDNRSLRNVQVLHVF